MIARSTNSFEVDVAGHLVREPIIEQRASAHSQSPVRMAQMTPLPTMWKPYLAEPCRAAILEAYPERSPVCSDGIAELLVERERRPTPRWTSTSPLATARVMCASE